MNRRKALQKTGLLASATVMMPTLLTVLQSCKTEKRLDWQPQFFDTDEALFVAAIADTILPRTDTPGALDVKVDIFLDTIIAQAYNEEAQGNMRAEIALFNANCKDSYGAAFSDLTDEDKKAMLQSAEEKSAKFNPGIWGTAAGKQEPVGFYRSLKSTLIWAYFTSEEMGEKVLSYDPIPQEFEACKPLDEVGNRWSL